jgi:hypothetical protein
LIEAERSKLGAGGGELHGVGEGAGV